MTATTRHRSTQLRWRIEIGCINRFTTARVCVIGRQGFGAWKTWVRRMRRTGFGRKAKPPAFCAMQDRKSAERFPRSVQGSNACVRRVAMEGDTGLARSTDCAVQWIHSGPKAALPITHTPVLRSMASFASRDPP